MAENLSEEELKGLNQMFKNIDTDRSGTITFDELKKGLSRLGSRLSEHEIKQLMDAVKSENLPYPLFYIPSWLSMFRHCNAKAYT